MRVSRFVVVMALLAGVLSIAQAGGDAQTATCLGRVATHVMEPGVPFVGTPGPDVIVGTSGDDVIRGRGGNDRICALGGGDRVWGNGGDDRINLGSGDDWAKGGKGDDRIWGKKGRDIAFGNGGEDRLNGGSGFDMLLGGKKADLLLGKSGADSLEGNSGPDTLRGGKGIDACDGGTGTNTLSNCNERTPFGTDPFVGWWTAEPEPGVVLTLSIDPAGNVNGFNRSDAGCGGWLRWTTRGRQSGATTWAPTSEFAATCESGVMTVNPGPFAWVARYDAATDTMTYGAFGTCYWRHASNPAACTT